MTHSLPIARLLVWALLTALLVWPAVPCADQAQYFYDELGRLVGVVDEAGNAAVYRYDEVGNLLSIERKTAGSTGIGIFLLTPGSGLVGETVQIQGFGFSETAGENQVKFNGAPASVSSATKTLLVVTVPSGAMSGPVTVTNANGTATSPSAFTVLVPPIITGIDPARVAQGTTSRVLIGGFNLASATAVTFTQPGLTATIQAGGTPQSLPVSIVVASTVPVGSYPFKVTTPAGTAQSGTVTVTVAAVVASFGPARALSVFFPGPAKVAPSGSSTSVVPKGLSVFLPGADQVAPSGSSMGVAPPESVSMP